MAKLQQYRFRFAKIARIAASQSPVVAQCTCEEHWSPWLRSLARSRRPDDRQPRYPTRPAGSPADAPEAGPGWMLAASEIRMLGVLAQLAGPTAIIRPAPAARCR
jgi:hypothetical protein